MKQGLDAIVWASKPCCVFTLDASSDFVAIEI